MTKEEYLQQLLKHGVSKTNRPKTLQTAKAFKYPQRYFKSKKCRHCGNIFVPNAPSEHYCSEFCKEYGVVDAYYRRVYGITLEEYLALAEQQDYACAICHRENFAMKECHSGVLVVDHNHKTGEVRGLLCHNCNRALGLLHDDIGALQSAISYLGRVTTIPKGSTT